jgi:hypothetical protein
VLARARVDKCTCRGRKNLGLCTCDTTKVPFFAQGTRSLTFRNIFLPVLGHARDSSSEGLA